MQNTPSQSNFKGNFTINDLNYWQRFVIVLKILNCRIELFENDCHNPILVMRNRLKYQAFSHELKINLTEEISTHGTLSDLIVAVRC